MAEDALDVHLEAQLARVLDRFDRGGGVVSSIHDAENVVVERLDTDRQPVDTEIAEDVQPLPTLGADKRAGVNVVVELSTAPEVDSVREEPEEPRELRRRQVRGRAPPHEDRAGAYPVDAQPPHVDVHLLFHRGQIRILLRLSSLPKLDWVVAEQAPLLAEGDVSVDVEQPVVRDSVRSKKRLFRDGRIHRDRWVVHRGKKVPGLADQPQALEPFEVRKPPLGCLDPILLSGYHLLSPQSGAALAIRPPRLRSKRRGLGP